MAKDSAILAAKVDSDLHTAFSDYARKRGGVSHVLRKLIIAEMEASSVPVPEDSGAGQGPVEIRVRNLSAQESSSVREMATERGMSATEWVRAMIRAYCRRRVTFSREEIEVWREVAAAIREFKSGLRQLGPAAASSAARELNSQALRMVADGIQGNLSYWDIEPTRKMADGECEEMAA